MKISFYFSTAFFALSLIAQTSYGAMSLRDYGWVTYRVRSHSIPPSSGNTDAQQSVERRISKGGITSSPRKSMSLQVTPPPPPSSTIIIDSPDNTINNDLNGSITIDVAPAFRYNLLQDTITSDVKSTRSLTMPSTILLNANEKNDIRHGK
jgi:hypothetical protein